MRGAPWVSRDSASGRRIRCFSRLCTVNRAREPAFLPRVAGPPWSRRARRTAERQGAARPLDRPAGISSRPVGLPGEEPAALRAISLLPRRHALPRRNKRSPLHAPRSPVPRFCPWSTSDWCAHRLRGPGAILSPRDITKHTVTHPVGPNRLPAKPLANTPPSHDPPLPRTPHRAQPQDANQTRPTLTPPQEAALKEKPPTKGKPRNKSYSYSEPARRPPGKDQQPTGTAGPT